MEEIAFKTRRSYSIRIGMFFLYYHNYKVRTKTIILYTLKQCIIHFFACNANELYAVRL